MVLTRNFLIHIYSTDFQPILFHCLLPLYQQSLKKEPFNFFYKPDNRRGDHLKVFFRFHKPISKKDFADNYIGKIKTHLEEKPSWETPVEELGKKEKFMNYRINFFQNFPNNSIYEFNVDHFILHNHKPYLFDNQNISENLIDLNCKYGVQIMKYAKDYNRDIMFSAAIVITDTLVSTFFDHAYEKREFCDCFYHDQEPDLNSFSVHDKEVRKSAKSLLSTLKEGRRKNFSKQKEFIKNLLDYYADVDEEDDDFPWIVSFKKDLFHLKSLLDNMDYTLTNSFRYRGSIQTDYQRQETWPLVECILSAYLVMLLMPQELILDTLYALKEHYRLEENLLTHP